MSTSRIVLGLVVLLGGCSTPAPVVVDGGVVMVDAPVGPDDAPIALDDAPSATDAPSTPGEVAAIYGNITRSTGPQAGGIGDVYVAVFTEDPIVAMDTAVVVGQVIVPNADMSASDASIAYRVESIPVRAEPYFVVAFLDDNHTATPADPAPDRGDLVSLMGFMAPSVTVDAPGEVMRDLVLTTALPF